MNSEEDRNTNIVKLLIENYNHPDYLNIFDVNDKKNRNSKNETVLFKAAEYAKPNVVKYLLEKSKAANNGYGNALITNTEKMTPFLVAAANGNNDVVKTMLEHFRDDEKVKL